MFLRIPLLAACRQRTFCEAVSVCDWSPQMGAHLLPHCAAIIRGSSSPPPLPLCSGSLPRTAPVMDALTWLGLHRRKETQSHFTEGFSGERPGNAATQEALWGPLGRKCLVTGLRCLKRMCLWVWDPCAVPIRFVHWTASEYWRCSH